jgi:hypothetical protein
MGAAAPVAVSVLRLWIVAKAGHWETEKADPQTTEARSALPVITRSRKTYIMEREGIGAGSPRSRFILRTKPQRQVS